jgi:hypothetical protein
MEGIQKAAEIAQDIIDKQAAGDPSIKKMMSIVHTFIQKEKVLCYGGTAINNILPPEKQFYDPSIDIPDYDFFSLTPQEHCRKLANLLKKEFQDVEAKPGVHLGTFKVFCNYTGVADISSMDPEIFKKLWKESIIKQNIHYVPANFLRMNIYLELSRPMGFVERWKKVYSRLQLLNSEYPVICPTRDEIPGHTDLKEKLEDVLIREKVVLLGFNAGFLQEQRQKWELPLDLLVEEHQVPKVTRELLVLFKKGHAKARSYEEYGDLLPAHTDILEGNVLVARIYETMACHSYHELSSGLRIGSIPTLLNFFFAMLYADKEFAEHTTRQRIICTAQRLVDMANNASKRRFELLTPITCIGKQKVLLDMKKERAELYEKATKDRALFKKYFFSYRP